MNTDNIDNDRKALLSILNGGDGRHEDWLELCRYRHPDTKEMTDVYMYHNYSPEGLEYWRIIGQDKCLITGLGNLEYLNTDTPIPEYEAEYTGHEYTEEELEQWKAEKPTALPFPRMIISCGWKR